MRTSIRPSVACSTRMWPPHFLQYPRLLDLAAFESAKELFALCGAYVLFLPQRERAPRRGGIMPAVFTMAVTHLQRIAAHFDLHRSTVASTHMRLGHACTPTARFAARRAKPTHPKSRD